MSNSNQADLDQRNRGVKSVEIGLSVLDVLINKQEPMKLKDIASTLQMHPAKTHRYLVSLVLKNYAEQLDDGSYGLGMRVDALRQARLNQNNILEQLTKIATDIKDALSCGVQIAKWYSEGPIVIKSIEPNTPISIITRVGSRMPLVTSATGKLLASYQPIEVIKPLVLAELEARLDKPINSSLFDDENKGDNTQSIEAQWQQFAKALIEIREQGYSCVTGDMLLGINAFSIPFDDQGTLEDTGSIITPNERYLGYSITVIGTAEQLPYSKRKTIINKMTALSQRHKKS